MKKRIILNLILLIILTLTGCTLDEAKTNDQKLPSEPAAKAEEMTLQPAILTTEEQKIFELMSGGTRGTIYDYNINKDIKTIRYEVVEYTDGLNPVVTPHGGLDFHITNGRIYIAHDINDRSLTVAIQEDKGGSSSIMESPQNMNDHPNSRTQTYLTNIRKIQMGEKIPISLILESDSDEMVTRNIESYMEDPDLLKEYRKAYLVTIAFE